MSDTLLQQAISAAKPREDNGVLRNDLQEKFAKGTTIVPGSVIVYREFKPMFDTIEFTLIFKADVRFGDEDEVIEKLRADFDLTSNEFEALETTDIESTVGLIAKVVARSRIYERRNERYMERYYPNEGSNHRAPA